MKSGTYRVIKGKLVKVSDHIPSLRPFVYWNDTHNHSGQYSESLGVHLKSREHKRQVLKEKGWVEA